MQALFFRCGLVSGFYSRSCDWLAFPFLRWLVIIYSPLIAIRQWDCVTLLSRGGVRAFVHVGYVFGMV
jgi:hypothetical protein